MGDNWAVSIHLSAIYLYDQLKFMVCELIAR